MFDFIKHVQWVRRQLKFHRDQAGAWKHPRAPGTTGVVAFLNHLANEELVAAATQNQALNAIFSDHTVQELPGHQDVSTTQIYTLFSVGWKKTCPAMRAKCPASIPKGLDHLVQGWPGSGGPTLGGGGMEDQP
jgi:hypothetical protein